ncbi:MAG: tRNA lysidine(34) synthetase TilS [Anditalea sp.]
MLDKFIRHIREKNLLDFDQHYLLAISGGLDSTVLAHLLHLSGFSFTMAHCNFGLRGEESDGDEIFIRELANRLAVKVCVKKFETKSYGQGKGISTQMAARELRYEWFKELSEQLGFAGILVAHHADDQIETVLLNLLRGTGIEGIYGMSETREKIIRPLLPYSRAELQAFAGNEKYEWREDSSNISCDYKRNFLRHQIVPRLREFDAAALSLLQFSFDRIKDTGKAFFYLHDAWLGNHIQKEEDFQYLEINRLNKATGKKTLLFYWLRTYGFNHFQMEDIMKSMDKQESGKTFHSKEYTLNVDREHLILGPMEAEYHEGWIEESDIDLQVGKDHYDILALGGDFLPDRASANAILDRDILNFPLKVRKWEPGDKFRPLGMKRFKKVSDLLIDLKVPLILKRNIKVLCSGDDIVWVIGIRIDDRYKLSQFTKSAIHFKKR